MFFCHIEKRSFIDFFLIFEPLTPKLKVKMPQNEKKWTFWVNKIVLEYNVPGQYFMISRDFKGFYIGRNKKCSK